MKQFSNQENFYKRLRELGNVDARAKSSSLDNMTLVEYTRANDGSALGIIKENDSFYIKSSNVKGDNIGVENFTYIGGVENKLKYKFSNLSEATKTRNFYINNLNESLVRTFTVAKTMNEKVELDAKIIDASGAKSLATATDNAQNVADKNKTDDASANLEAEKIASTVNGPQRGDIAKIQGIADQAPKGEPIKDTAKQVEIDSVINKTGVATVQNLGDQNKGEDKSVALKATEPKEIEPASDAHKEKAIVVENFGEKDPTSEPASPEVPAAPMATSASAEAPTPPTAPSPSPTPEMGIEGGEDPNIAAATAALDNLDIAPDAGAETGSPAMGDSSPASGTKNAAIGDDAALKDAEKLVGKTGQVIRSTELTPEMTGGFLKSLLSAFEAKIADLDPDLKRELSNTILKSGESGEVSNGSPESTDPTAGADASSSPDAEVTSSSSPEASSSSPEAEPDDQEIEEAINSHLSELAGGNETDSEVKPFKGYMEDRGYNPEDVNEVSIMEMVSLVNGYLNECEDIAKADVKTIAEYMTPEVKEGVVESGFGQFAESANVYSVKVKSPKKYSSVGPKIVTEEFEEEPKVEEGKKVDFAPIGDSLNKKETKKDEDSKKEEVSESAKKLKAIIKTKIQERLGLKKKTLTESSKSNLSKKIDIMIDEEIKKNKDFLKNYNIK